MKTQIVLLRIAGSICLLFMFSHLAFYKMFHWESSLNCLATINRAIMLTYHIIIILVIGFMAIISIFQTRELLKSAVKYSVLSMFALFFLIRIVTEFTYFGFSFPHSAIIIFMCAIPIVLFSIPLILSNDEKN